MKMAKQWTVVCGICMNWWSTPGFIGTLTSEQHSHKDDAGKDIPIIYGKAAYQETNGKTSGTFK
jgi:hypothetical protein